MPCQLFGLTLRTLGELCIAVTVLNVHRRVVRRHRIDDRVLREMRLEIRIGIIGIVLIVAGFIFEASCL